MPERLHGKRDYTVAEAVDVILIRRDQPTLSGFLTRGDVERAAQRLADHVVAHEALRPFRRGDEVTGDRAVTAPIDTTLRHTTAAVVALRTVNGWSLTGWTAEADPEHHVRVNTWRVVEVGEGGGETGE